MTAVTAGTRLADGLGMRGPSPAQTTGPAVADRAQATARRARAVRSWPLLVLAAPAAAEVWSGWVGIAQKTGFGLVSPLPGIWPTLHLDTSITLPVGVEAYAEYALGAWLAGEQAVSAWTRRFAKWSAIFSFALGMAGQVAYHLLAQAGVMRAPWAITTTVSCLPVLVLAMGTALAHMLRADVTSADIPNSKTRSPAAPWLSIWSRKGQTGPDQDPAKQGRTVCLLSMVLRRGGACPRSQPASRLHGPQRPLPCSWSSQVADRRALSSAGSPQRENQYHAEPYAASEFEDQTRR